MDHFKAIILYIAVWLSVTTLVSSSGCPMAKINKAVEEFYEQEQAPTPDEEIDEDNDMVHGKPKNEKCAYLEKIVGNDTLHVCKHMCLSNNDTVLETRTKRSLTPACDASSPYRTADGSCNNLEHVTWGQAGQPQPRLLPNSYDDGQGTPRSTDCVGGDLRSPREISNAVHFSSNEKNNDPKLSYFVMTFGQFLAHEIVLTPQVNGLKCCGKDKYSPDCLPIEVPDDEATLKSKCLNFQRSRSNNGYGVREQINLQTPYIDASTVYGPSQTLQDLLRGSKRQGRLDSVISDDFEREKLPADNDDAFCQLNGKEGKDNYCNHAGDVRVDENPMLSSLHTLFMREHNRVVGRLQDFHPTWSDERLFQEARKIVAAELQHITYNEYLPALVGEEILKDLDIDVKGPGFKNMYNSKVIASTRNSFNAATFRLGHSQIQGNIGQLSEDYTPIMEPVDFDKNTFRVDLYHKYGGRGIDNMLRWGVTTECRRIDVEIEDAVRDRLFSASDLAAQNIQRGRDHGIPSYNAFRAFYGLPIAEHFGTNTGGLIDMDNFDAFALSQVYRCPDDIDLFTGLLAERHVDGASVGRLHQLLLAKQFKDLRIGDRFFYEEENRLTGFSLDQLNAIKRVTMASLICANTNSVAIQENVFLLANKGPNRGRRLCDEIPTLGMAAWANDGYYE